MNRNEAQLHIILPRIEPVVSFAECADVYLGEPVQVLEVWQLGPTGRYDGEPLGWIGVHAKGIAWRMAPGIGGRYARGFEAYGPKRTPDAVNAATNRVVHAMKLAIEGGKAAERRAGEVLVGGGA